MLKQQDTTWRARGKQGCNTGWRPGTALPDGCCQLPSCIQKLAFKTCGAAQSSYTLHSSASGEPCRRERRADW